MRADRPKRKPQFPPATPLPAGTRVGGYVIRNVLLAAQPSKRFAEVDELGALAAFLCTDAARSITGVALPVDGGWTAQ